MPSFDNVVNNWIDNENVLVFQSLGDIGQPYSCNDWGNQGVNFIPMILDDTGYPMFNMFNTGGYLPSIVFINHEMKVIYKDAGFPGVSFANNKIQEMLDELYSSLILGVNPEITLDNELDDDGVLNPGEGFTLSFSVTNNSFYVDGSNVVVSLSCGDGLTITSDELLDYGNILLGESVPGSFTVLANEDAGLGKYELTLSLEAGYINDDGENVEYDKVLNLEVEVSLNQAGFPVYISAQIKPSPLVIDLDGDGTNEIIFGDGSGIIHILNENGSEIENETFPFDTGDEIWGSTAAADLDLDGNIDFAVASKSKHLYIFDKDGLKTDYSSFKYLMGTPAIGNLDDDPELEVVFSGYSSSNKLFAINHDGSDVAGFPITLDEKVKAGVSLADLNGNGKDDIVVGTDDDNVYLIYDDGSTAAGFPFLTGDKVQASPAIVTTGNGSFILAGCNDDNLYGINLDGSLRFTVETGNKVTSSPGFLVHESELYIFFGSTDGYLYAFDEWGSAYSGWPRDLGTTANGSVVFADLDANGEPEIITATEIGEFYAFNLLDEEYDHFPVVNEYSFPGSPMVMDLDGDGDLEILAGASSNFFVADIKEIGDAENYWNIFKGDKKRSGHFIYSGGLENEAVTVPGEFKISRVYPNPFNPAAHIQFEVPSRSEITLAVFNLNGKEVELLKSGTVNAGIYQNTWNADAQSSGVYLIRLTGNSMGSSENYFTQTQKIVLVK